MSDEYASLGEHREILMGPSGLQLDNQEMVDLVNNLQAENERLKDDCNAILGRFLNLLPDADVLKACESEQSLLAYFKEKLARLAEYESTPERGLRAVLGFHKIIDIQHGEVGGGGWYSVGIEEYRYADLSPELDTRVLTAEDIEE